MNLMGYLKIPLKYDPSRRIRASEIICQISLVAFLYLNQRKISVYYDISAISMLQFGHQNLAISESAKSFVGLVPAAVRREAVTLPPYRRVDDAVAVEFERRVVGCRRGQAFLKRRRVDEVKRRTLEPTIARRL